MRAIASALLLFLAAPVAANSVDYATQIQPILEASCTKCHGAKRSLGDLALHTSALPGVIEDGYILEGDAESSSVYERLTLDADDKLLMPKGGKPLPADQVALIKQWIEEGASLEGASPETPHMPAGPSHEPENEGPSPAPASEAVLQGLTELGASVVPLFEGSPLLSISFPSNPATIGDAQLDAVAAAGPNVAWLSLGGSSVTDAGGQKLAASVNLSRLHLEKTAVTDASAAVLASLERLSYLNLYGTELTDSGIEPLAALPNLKRLYVWQTPVTYETAKRLMAEHPELEINLGWDHPGVVRDRLNAELQRVATRKEEAAKQAAAAEQQLAAAKQSVESATAREEEIKKELQSLDSPAGDDKQDKN